MINFIKNIWSKNTSPSLTFKKKIISYAKEKQLNILEAGASIGEDTPELAKLTKGMVYACEPVSKAFRGLQNRTRNFKNVSLHQVALSNFTGETNMFVSTNNLISGGGAPVSSSILKPKEHIDFHPHIKFPERELVKVFTIKDWAAINNIKRIEIMWLDMQGGEWKALSKAGEILNTTEVIFTEVSLKQMYEDAPLYPEFKKKMFNIGFKVAEEFLDWEDMGNVLFIRR